MRWLTRIWASLSPAERQRTRSAAGLLVTVIAGVAMRRLLATAVVATSASVLTLSLAGSAPQPKTPGPAPILQPWLYKAGRFHVERVSVPCVGAKVDLRVPPTGVGHTVEGSWEAGLSVFRQHYAPHFMVGRDRAGVVRIVQFCPLGEMAAALQNRAGGVETNRWARAQIEFATSSRPTPWHLDAGVEAAAAALLEELRRVAGIPLSRPFPDSLGAGTVASYGYSRRYAGKWGRVGGWYNHAEVPENAHWDMGAFSWTRLFGLAQQLAPLIAPGHEKPGYYTWVRWRLGHSEYRGRARDPRVRPGVPERIPAAWWRRLEARVAA